MKNKISLLLISAVLISVALPCPAADAVEPATLTITNLRDEAVANASDVFFYKGASARVTNSVIFAGATTNAARQGLSEVALELKVGNATTSTAYSGSAQVASNGTWSCNFTVPTNEGRCYLQLKITDVNTNIYIFGWKELFLKDPL